MNRVKWFAVVASAWTLMVAYAVAKGNPDHALAYAGCAITFAILDLASK